MKGNKIKQSECREIMRSQINFANYNPRKITKDARKKLKANLKRVGVLGGIVWNETTGNLVSGHQKVSIIDEINKYDAAPANDYPIRVEVIQMDLKTEKEQNLFMNNRNVQGEFDTDMLRDMLDGIDFERAGLNELDLGMLGIGDCSDIGGNNGDWSLKNIEDENVMALAEHTKGGEENKNVDRSVNFYDDTPENKVIRHNEVQKIKDRIGKQNNYEKDNGMLSYVVLSFSSPTERANFMDMFGYSFEDRYIDGNEFMNRVEFGLSDNPNR